MKSFNRTSAFGAAVLCLAFAGMAAAGTVSYNSTIQVPTGGTTSVYFGTGNTDGAWTVDNETDGIEIALRGAIRTSGPVTPTGTPQDTYIVPVGASGINLAFWDVEYSIDLDPTGSGSTLDFTKVTQSITVTDLTDPTRSVLVFNPVGNGVNGPADDAKVGNIAAQNSENPAFANPYLANPFNLNAQDTYQVTLAVFDLSAHQLASDTIDVEAVAPEPSTWLLLLAGSSLILVARFRKTCA